MKHPNGVTSSHRTPRHTLFPNAIGVIYSPGVGGGKGAFCANLNLNAVCRYSVDNVMPQMNKVLESVVPVDLIYANRIDCKVCMQRCMPIRYKYSTQYREYSVASRMSVIPTARRARLLSAQST